MFNRLGPHNLRQSNVKSTTRRSVFQRLLVGSSSLKKKSKPHKCEYYVTKTNTSIKARANANQQLPKDNTVQASFHVTVEMDSVYKASEDEINKAPLVLEDKDERPKMFVYMKNT